MEEWQKRVGEITVAVCLTITALVICFIVLLYIPYEMPYTKECNAKFGIDQWRLINLKDGCTIICVEKNESNWNGTVNWCT